MLPSGHQESFAGFVYIFMYIGKINYYTTRQQAEFCSEILFVINIDINVCRKKKNLFYCLS